MLIKSNWRNILPAAVAALAAPLVVAVQAAAANTATVAATVTPQNISVSVTDGVVAYGTLDVSSTKDTTSGGTQLNDTQTATNDGNVAEDFNISSTDATGGNTWTLAGSVGADQYKHAFCNTGSGSPDPCDTSPTWTAMSTSYGSLATNISSSATSKFDLQISTPSSVTDYVQKSITVTVQAVLH